LTLLHDGHFILLRYQGNGALDPAFAGDGWVMTDFGNASAMAESIEIQPDGRIVGAGSGRGTHYPDLDFVVARFAPSGSLDPGFAHDGYVQTNIGNGADWADDVVVQPDGKILVTGGNIIARYNANGSMDTEFGNGGNLFAFQRPTYSRVYALALQTDGKIIAAGGTVEIHDLGWTSSSNADFALQRYHPDGTLDTSFGAGGTVVFAGDAAYDDNADALQLLPDGRLLVSGRVDRFPSPFTAVIRVNADGTVDQNFGPYGVLATRVYGGRRNNLLVQPDGKILVGGAKDGSTVDFALERYTSDGSVDWDFGEAGLVTTHFDDGGGAFTALALQPDGKISAAGIGRRAAGEYFLALARYNPNGTLDTGFSGDGRATGAAFNFVREVLILPNRQIVVVGAVNTDADPADALDDTDWVVTRHNPDGTPDTSFGAAGKVMTRFGPSGDIAEAAALQGDGRLLVAGYADIDNDLRLAVARFGAGRNVTLRVAKPGTGTGRVRSEPAGIDCGADCSHEYAPGTAVRLLAAPEADSIFAGWSSPCAGVGACTVTMNSDREMAAVFVSPSEERLYLPLIVR
jgi:uncharacterized delta-60 repeat protein